MPSESETDWSWKLRLFASADLVGSTAFKASQTDSRWAPTFKEFFSDFPTCLAGCYGNLPAEFEVPDDKFIAWKFSGDEILFWVQLKKSTHVASHLLAFKNAVSQFPKQWEEKKIPLKLKATAWIAGFPVTNTEIRIGGSETNEGNLDFIGPSMDLGFRIAKYTTVRQFVLSADLAMMLLDSIDLIEAPRKHFQMHLHGLEQLKGVIDNEPYPIFWVDTRDGEILLEEKLLGVHRDFRADDIKEYLRHFIDKTQKLRRPFIDGDPNSRYSKPNCDLEKLRASMQEQESNRHYSASEAPAPTGESREPKVPIKPPEDGDVMPGVPG